MGIMSGGTEAIPSGSCKKKIKVNNPAKAVNSAKSCRSVATTYQL